MWVTFVVLMLVWAGSSQSIVQENQTDWRVKIVHALQVHLNIGCVFLIHSSDDEVAALLEHNLLLQQLQRASVQRAVQTSAVPFSSLTNATQQLTTCRHRPINVVLPDEDTGNALQNVSQKTNLSWAKWLLFLDNHTTPESFLEGVNIPFDCHFLVARKEESNVIMTEVYRVLQHHPLQKNWYATWTPEGQLNVTTTFFHVRRSDMKGITLRAVVFHTPPFMSIIQESNTTILTGFFSEVWNTLSERMNFTTEYINQENGVWGSRLPNGSWSGGIGQLERKQADVIVADMTQTVSREEAVDFSRPVLISRGSVYIRESGGRGILWTSFLKPFTASLWFVTCTTVVCISILLTYLHQFGRSLGNAEAEGPNVYTFYNSLHFICGTFCMQGHEVTPRAWSCRLVYLIAYFTTIVLYALYSAALISLLAVRRAEYPFETLAGLLEDGTYKLGILADGGFLTMFYNSSNELIRATYEQLILPEKSRLPRTDVEGIMRVCTRTRYAYLTSVNSEKYFEEAPCQLSQLPQASIRDNLAFAVQSGSPYKRLINYHLLDLHRSGVLKRLYISKWPHKLNNEDIQEISVGVEDIASLLVLLAAADVLAICILLIEKKGPQIFLSCQRLITRVRYAINTHST